MWATSRLGALTLRHPARWHAYLVPGGGDLPSGDDAYLTDESIAPPCAQTPSGSAASVHCAHPSDFPRGPRPGQMWVEVETDYTPLTHPVHGHLNLAGYRAHLWTAARGRLGFPVAANGYPVAFCTHDTDLAETVAASAPNPEVQPSGIEITGCFGARTAADRRAFRGMLRTVTITRTPSQTAHVGHAPRCTRDDVQLRIDDWEGVSQSIVESFVYTNTSSATCRLQGYPRIVLQTTDGRPVTSITYRHPGRPQPLFLRPRATVTSGIQAFIDYDLHAHADATSERIYLPDARQPFIRRLARRAIPITGRRQTVDVSPIEGT